MKDKILVASVCLLFAFAALGAGAQTTPAQTTPAYPAAGQTGVTQAAPSQAATTLTSIPAGTQLQIRTNQAIEGTQANVGQQFSAEIADNVLDSNGNILIPKGSPAQLTIAKLSSGTAGVGSNEVSLALQSINVNGRTLTVQTNPVTQGSNRGIGANKRTAEMTGGGALLGTLIGAAAGGAKGAIIGAVVGGAGGAAVQVATRGHEVKVPAETVLTFKLDQPLQLQ